MISGLDVRGTVVVVVGVTAAVVVGGCVKVNVCCICTEEASDVVSAALGSFRKACPTQLCWKAGG